MVLTPASTLSTYDDMTDKLKDPKLARTFCLMWRGIGEDRPVFHTDMTEEEATALNNDLPLCLCWCPTVTYTGRGPRVRVKKTPLQMSKALVAEAVRRAHHRIPVHFSSAVDGGLEFYKKSLASGKKESGRPETSFRFVAKDVLDLLHELKRKVNEL